MRVLIPLIVLILGAVGAAIYFGSQDPVEVESEEFKQARLEAEARLGLERKRARAAQKELRRRQAAMRWQGLKIKRLELQLRNPIESVYKANDERVDAARELPWNDLGRLFDEFATHELATEFESESQYATNAREEAEKIRTNLRELKEGAAD